MPLFQECRDRIRRASVHSEAFYKHWDALIKDDSYRIEGKVESNGAGVLKAIRLSRPESDIALELGEFFYQLRASLDSAIYQAMVEVTCSDPPPDENQLLFPICAKASQFKKRASYFAPLPDELRDWIEDIQPYNTVKTDNTPIAGINAILRLLNDCARKDRHRRLHVVAAPLTEMSGNIRFDPPARLLFFEGVACNLLNDECELARFRVIEFSPTVQIDVDGKLNVDISVDEIPGIRGNKLGQTLKALVVATEMVIKRFENTFT